MGGKALGVVFSEQEFDSVTTDELTVSGAVSMAGAVEFTGTTLGFYGTSPIAQPAAVTAVTTTGATNTTLAWGYTTSTQANALVTAVNALITKIKALGLTA